MNIKNIADLFKKNNFKVFEFDNFIEFHGKMKNKNDELYDVEGTIGFENEKDISYSLNFLDIKNDKEYDGFFGSIANVNKDKIIDLITPNFVECC